MRLRTSQAYGLILVEAELALLQAVASSSAVLLITELRHLRSVPFGRRRDPSRAWRGQSIWCRA